MQHRRARPGRGRIDARPGRYASGHARKGQGLAAAHPMTTADLFVVVQEDNSGQHRFTLLEPNGPLWVDRMAAIYRDLRTETRIPIAEAMYDGLDFDMGAIRKRMIETQLPTRHPERSHLAVERSDLAEVALALAGEQLREYLYGYRSTRDRELVKLPGRGIDQIGVSKAIVAGRTVIYLSLGEAKLSSEKTSPPQVVNKGKDSLDAQHRGHLTEAETAAKILSAAKNATDPTTQSLLFAAGLLWEKQGSDSLVVRCTSMLVRPSHGKATDAGPFRDTPDDYLPGEVDFMLLCLPYDDVEEAIDAFLTSARKTDDVEKGADPSNDGEEGVA